MLLVEWSVPERRRGSQILNPVPYEIWLDVFDDLRPGEETSHEEYRHALLSLTLVCRLFYIILQPLLFDRLSFSGNEKSSENDLEWYEETMYNADKPGSLVPFVKKYTLRHLFTRSRELQEDMFLAHVARHLEILPCLSHLQSLSLFGSAIDLPFLEAIQGLSTLEELSFKLCSFRNPHKYSTPMRVGSMARLRRFEFMRPQSGGNDLRIHLPTIMHLVICPSLRVFQTDSYECASALLDIPKSTQIEELSIVLDVLDLQYFCKFLNETPSIVDLSIPFMMVSVPTPFGPPPRLRIRRSSLPNLRTLECPNFFIDKLVPNRPIHRVHIYRPPPLYFGMYTFGMGDILVLKRSTVPIQDLTIPISLYKTTPLKEHFPDLRTLTLFDDLRIFQKEHLVLRDEELPVQRICSKCDGVNEFSSIDLFDLPRQRRALDVFKAAFPYATRICVFFDFIEWRRSDSQSTVWKPFVTDRDEVKNRLESHGTGFLKGLEGSKVVDEAGFLAGLFRSNELTPSLRILLNLDDPSI